MFNFLMSGDIRINEFIYALREKYDWLYEALNSRIVSQEYHQEETDKHAVEAVRRNFRREIPKFEDHYIERPEFVCNFFCNHCDIY